MMNKIKNFVVAGTLFLAACGGNTEQNTSESVDSTAAVTAPEKASMEIAPERFSGQLELIYKDYLQLKEAFVATDSVKASVYAGQLIKDINSIDSTGLSTEKAGEWLASKVALLSAAESIKTQKNIEMQRTAFSNLSEQLYSLLSSLGIKGSSIYKQHCPMAFENKGANWLSDKPEIANPYYGDQMMECGEVKEVIKN